MPLPPKRLTPQQAYIKAGRFCAYQERTQQEVRDKLYSYGLYSNDVEQILTRLIEENFVNEERYAKTIAGSKFRQKKWGRVKILHLLKSKKLSAYCIKQAMAEIDDESYWKTLLALLEKKRATIDETHPILIDQKLLRYAVRKGYESDWVWKAIKYLKEMA
ncbi:MAG TPA: RecX family transcriptional regulator [Microscillaceae bacterium]|jgi:regulatory protein|nr:RecX family transcriptional regulator [Microscillaceae bacterium]